MTLEASVAYGQPLHDSDGREFTARCGTLTIRVNPDQQRAVLTRRHNGTVNSVGLPACDIAAALTLLQTAADWLAT